MKSKRFLRTFALLGLLFSTYHAFANALDNWQWRNPLPNGNLQSGPHQMNGLVFATGKFVAVGAVGVVSISTDATNWNESATATTNNLNGLIFASGQFVAVGDGGSVETSADGTNWVLQNSGTTSPLSAVAYASGKFVAVGGFANGQFVGNAVITSSDAINWLSSVSGLSGATGVAGGSAGFVAVNATYNSGSNYNVYFSADGSTWAGQELTAPGNSFAGSLLQNCIVTYADGAYLIGSYRYATSASADNFIFRSTDGITWTTIVLGNVVTFGSGFSYNFFFSDDRNVIAAGYAGGFPFLRFSADGVDWSTTNSISSPYYQGTAGAFGNGHYVIVAPANTEYALPPIFTSTDGLTWVNQQHPPTPPVGTMEDLTSITSSNGIYVVAGANSIVRSTNGLVYTIAGSSPVLASIITFSNKFIGVGPGGNIYVSGDGLSWTQRNSGTSSNLRGIAAGSSLLVAVGDNGAIQTSPTGAIWTSRTAGTSLTLSGVAYANSLYVAAGQLGTVLTSPDGINWTGQDSGQLTNLLSVTYGSMGFLAVGQGGTILTSPDGVNWTAQSSGTSVTLESVAFGNGYYLATGDNATALISPDGINWTPRNLGAIGGQNFYGAAFINSRFDVVGAGGTILESDVIPPLFDVQIHPGGNWITAFAPMGSNFRIQTSTNLAVSVWTDIATINNSSGIFQWTNPATGFIQLFYRAVSP